MKLKPPSKRNGFTREASIAGHKIFLRTGEYEDGTLAEIFIDMYKEGASFKAMLNSFAVSISKGLQNGIPLSEYVDTFAFTRFEPSGIVTGHEHIKMCTSILDYVMKSLAIDYLGRTDLIQGNNHIEVIEEEKTGIVEVTKEIIVADTNEMFDKRKIAIASGYIGEPCSACGSMMVKRNGTCSVCEECGITSGCS